MIFRLRQWFGSLETGNRILVVTAGVAFLAVVATLVVPVVTKYLDRPKLEGSFSSSFGTTPRNVTSVVILFYAVNSEESPVVPNDYDVIVRYAGKWQNIQMQRKADKSRYINFLSSPALSSRPLFEDERTGCFYNDSFLLGPNKLNQSYKRDKPLIGILHAFSNIEARELSKLDMRVVVRTVDGREFEIGPGKPRAVESINNAIINEAKFWLPGIVDCPPAP